jgi:hypothetical protein
MLLAFARRLAILVHSFIHGFFVFQAGKSYVGLG